MQARRMMLGGLALASACLMPLAQAEPNGWYGAFSGGATRYALANGTFTETAQSFYGSGLPPGNYARDVASNRATGWTLDAGYRFNAYLALEAGVADFGAAPSTFTLLQPPKTRLALSTRVRGETLEAVGSLPVRGGLALFAKAGLLFYKTQWDSVLFNISAPRP